MIIRNATEKDLLKIADLHIKCFPDSFSTQLGGKLLARFYLEYLKKVPELFLVAESDKEIVGVCMGYYCEDNVYQKKFLWHNLISLIFKCLKLTLMRNELMLKKMGFCKSKQKNAPTFQKVDVNEERKQLDKCGDLLSICVRADFQGHGVSSNLVKTFHEVLKGKNREVCFLSVLQKNSRAISFYKKMGYRIIKDGTTIKMETDL